MYRQNHLWCRILTLLALQSHLSPVWSKVLSETIHWLKQPLPSKSGLVDLILAMMWQKFSFYYLWLIFNILDQLDELIREKIDSPRSSNESWKSVRIGWNLNKVTKCGENPLDEAKNRFLKEWSANTRIQKVWWPAIFAQDLFPTLQELSSQNI